MSKKSGKTAARAPTASRPSQIDASASSSKVLWSEDGLLYAHLSLAHDAHTVRIYAVATGGRCIARWASTTGEQVRCMTWLDLPSSSSTSTAAAPSRGKKRRKGNDEATTEEAAPPTMQTTAQTALALGLDDGAVLLLHLTTSAIIARLEDPAGVNSPLSALTCPRRTTGTLLWTVDDLGTIRAFSLSSTGGHLLGRSKGAGQGYGAALAVRYTSASTARVLVARFDIRQLDISLASSASLDLAQNIIGEPAAGHASEVRGVEWLNDQGAAFASFAHNDRVVNLWRDNGDLAALTTLDEPPRSIEIRGNVVVAVTVTNEVAIVEIPIDALETDEAGTKKKVVSVPVGSRVGSGVRAARLEDDQLRIARGNELKPVFESVDYRDRSGALLPNIDLGAVTSTALLLDEDGDVNMGAPLAPARYKEPNAAGVTSTLTTSAQDLPRRNEGELDVDMAGPTLASRLKSLKIPSGPAPSRGEVAIVEEDDAMLGEEGGRGGREHQLKIIPQATLAQTLVQALHSSDSELIESCLSTSNVKVITSTVKRLPTSLVLPLIDHVVERLSRGKRGYGAAGTRGRSLVSWLRTAMIIHVGYLVTVPDLVARLSALHGTLHHRLEAHTALLGLSGRLELVSSQIEMRREQSGRPTVRTAVEASGTNTQALQRATRWGKAPPPVRKYVEGASESSSSEEEEEDGGEEWGGMEVDEEAEGEIEDVGLGLGGEEEEGSSEDEEEEDEAPVANGVKTNGFLDLDAEEASDDEDFEGGDESDDSDVESEVEDEDEE